MLTQNLQSILQIQIFHPGCNSNLGYSVTTGQPCGATTTGTPSVTVIYPNGRDIYQAGQQITVKWKTENIPAGYKGTIYFK